MLINYVYKYTVLNVLFICLLLPNFTEILHAQSYSIKTILTTETELVPGTNLKVAFIGPDFFAINNNGDIILSVSLSDGSAGLIRYSNGSLELLAKTVIAQSLNENAFLEIGRANINDKGEIVLFANYNGKAGLFKLFNGDIIPLVIHGDPINGLDVPIIKVSSRPPSLNNNGEIVFEGDLPEGRCGLFLFKNQQGLEAILIDDEQFPVFNGNETVAFASLPTINDKSEIVLRVGYFFDEAKEKAHHGIFLFRNGEFIPIKLPGMEVPRTGGNIFLFAHLNRPYLGNNSQIIYFARYCNPDIPGDCDESNPNRSVRPWGLFLWSEGETIALVLPGDLAPGTNGSTFVEQSSLLTLNAMNDFGDIAAFLHYDDVGGIYLLSDDKIIPVILYENPLLEDAERPFLTSPCGINNRGDIVFPGVLKAVPPLIGVFLAVREDVSFEVTNLEPATSIKDSRLRLEVTGTGFQPGASVSFSGNSVRVLRTDFKTSTTLIATVNVKFNARFGPLDVIVTNPTGDVAVLEKGFKVTR